MKKNEYRIPMCKTCWYKRLRECPGETRNKSTDNYPAGIDFENKTCGAWRDKDIDLIDRSSQSDKRGKKQRCRGRGNRGGGYDGQS